MKIAGYFLSALMLMNGLDIRGSAGQNPEMRALDACRDKLMPLVGTRIRVSSVVRMGKEADAVTYRGCPLYLRSTEAGPNLDGLEGSRRRRAILLGTLGYFPAAPSGRDDYQSIPEYFYLEVQRLIRIRSWGR